MKTNQRTHSGLARFGRGQAGNAGGYILAILLIGGGITMGSRLAPLYLDHNTMATIVDKLAEEPGMGGKGDTELRNILRKRLKLNNIRDFDLNQHVTFKRSGRGTELVMDYEVRMPLIHNLDIVASFNKEKELRD